MLKRIYSKSNEAVMHIDGSETLEDMMKFIVPNSLIRWVGEKRRYKCIARSDNFIIVCKPFNLRKDYDGGKLVQYSIFDLTQMKCNRDNLVFGIYDYSNKESCMEALECLENSLLPFEERHTPNEDGSYTPTKDILEISQRGICNIKDIVEEIYIEVERGKC